MGKAVDAYRRMEKAIDDFLDTIQDATYEVDDRYEDTDDILQEYGVSYNDLYQQEDSPWLTVAKEIDSGAFQKKVEAQYEE